jgi:hypothetical protein
LNFRVESLNILTGGAVGTGSRKELQVPIEAVADEIETLTPADELEARKQIEAEEVAEFITRQVLERDATFFDG